MIAFHAAASRFKSDFDEAVKKIEAGDFTGAAAIVKKANEALDDWSGSIFAALLQKVEARGVRLIRMPGDNPEQYEAFIGMDKIGYLRLQNRTFTVEYLSDYTARSIVYTAKPDGVGTFSGYERSFYLNAAQAALIEAYVKDKIDAMP